MLLGMGHSLELLLSGFNLRVAGSHDFFFSEKVASDGDGVGEDGVG